MSGFLRALAKMGLVELDEGDAALSSPEPEMSDEEARRIVAAASGRSSEPAAASPAPAPPVALAPIDELVEGRAFSVLYEEAQVRPSPFPAEKLLRLLEGLEAMDPATRKAAIHAMDAADDAWTIQDSMLDASRKIAVLTAQKDRLDALVRGAEDKARGELAAKAEYREKAGAEIRRQIAELEALLASEVETITRESAAIEAHLEATRAAAARERSRLDAEEARLAQISALFAPSNETGSP